MCIHVREAQTFSVKGQIISILVFSGKRQNHTDAIITREKLFNEKMQDIIIAEYNSI